MILFRNNLYSLINTQLTTRNDTVTSQPINPSSSINSALLESIPEYRSLKKDLAQERQKRVTWSEDFNKLKDDFDKYRASSFRECFSRFSY